MLDEETARRVLGVVGGMRALRGSSHPVTSTVIVGRGFPTAQLGVLRSVGGSDVEVHEEGLFELLLGEPEIVAWLDAKKHEEDDEEEKPA